jgi:hypothetical protein
MHDSELYSRFMPSSEGKTFWIEQPYLRPETRDGLLACNVLLIPERMYREHTGPFFLRGSSDLLAYLQDQDDGSLVVGIASEEERELALNFDFLTIGTWVICNVAVPVATTLIANYIQKRLEERGRDTGVECKIVLDNPDGEGTHYRLDFKGPSETFLKTLHTLRSPQEKGRSYSELPSMDLHQGDSEDLSPGDGVHEA